VNCFHFVFLKTQKKMGLNSKIGWTNHTVNLWVGCSKYNRACYNCYAEQFANRFNIKVWGNNKPRQIVKTATKTLRKIQRRLTGTNTKELVFVGSLMDIFETGKPVVVDGKIQTGLSTYDLRRYFFDDVELGLYPNLIFLLLTKRPHLIRNYIPKSWLTNPPQNVWIGASAFDEFSVQTAVDTLKHHWSGKRFLSIEPQLKKIETMSLAGIDWVVTGCESGANRRPYSNLWANEIVNICREQNVPVFVKQIRGKKNEVITDVNDFEINLQVQEYPAEFEKN